MERFKAATAARYRPQIAVHATLECDVIVRTVCAPHRTLVSLLSSTIPHASSPPTATAIPADPSATPPAATPPPDSPAPRFRPASALHPHIWVDATRQLEATLRSSSATQASSAILPAYAATLEAVTAVTDHDRLSSPLLTLLCVWVGERDLLQTLATLAAAAARTSADVTIPPPPPPHVLLVQRGESRQDASAFAPALAAARAAYGDDAAHVLTLGLPDGPASAPALTAHLATLAREQLAADVAIVAREADRLRRASRSTFRSWLTGAAPGTPLRKPLFDVERDAYAPRHPPSPVLSHASSTPSPRSQPDTRHRRRVSISGGAVPTPQFAPDSLEALTRHLADLYVLSGRYADALDAYRLLQSDLRALTGAALVHDASAVEMAALCLALVDGSKQGVGNGLEKAIETYCRAGRRELAVRATIRGLTFCNDAGFPDSAAGVIIRAIDAILPSKPSVSHVAAGAAPAANSFVEAALAVLCTSCSAAYAALSKHRRSSLYAFLAANKFAKLKLSAAAACVARDVDAAALLRTGVHDAVEQIFGDAELTEGRYARAVGHFIRIMSVANESTDVEVQSNAIQGFLTAVAKGAHSSMAKRWDSGAMFPLIEGSETSVTTYDSRSEADRAWQILEDDVLEDYEFFQSLSEKSAKQGTPKRERRVEAVIAELRKKKESGDRSDPGGSLEMKVKRMRELAESRRVRRRSESLLTRGAVVGESVTILASLRNPLQFPVFVNNLTAVVLLNGKCLWAKSSEIREEESSQDDCPVEFMRTDDVTLGPSSSLNITLRVKVREAGVLQFIGLSWTFTVGMGGASPQSAASMAPGFGVLERLGRRLNDTRRQRASDTPLYAEDKSLFVTVVPPAPRIRATLMSLSQSDSTAPVDGLKLRAGERREARLIIKNEGQVLLEEAVIRIGTPQSVFVDVAPNQSLGGREKQFLAIGLDEEAVRSDQPVAAARLSLYLEPGQFTERVVWLRAAVPNTAFSYRSGSGIKLKHSKLGGRFKDARSKAEGFVRCVARLAFAYGNGKTRVSRVNACFMVRPSIKVSPRFLREADGDVLGDNRKKRSGVLVGLEVEHGGQDQAEPVSYEVTHLSVTSQKGWKPMLLPCPALPDDFAVGEASPSASKLRANETATVFALLVLDEKLIDPSNAKESPQQGLWHTSTVSLPETGQRESITLAGGEHMGEELPTMPDYVLSASPRLSEKPSQALESQASSHYIICANHISQIASVMARVPIQEVAYVAVGWRSATGICGEMYIPPIEPLHWVRTDKRIVPADGPVAPILDLTGMNDTISQESLVEINDKVLQHPLQVKVVHPSTLEHDFFGTVDNSLPSEPGSKAAFPAVVPVDVYVKNMSQTLMDVAFAAPADDGVADGDRGRHWAGDVSMSLRSIPPGAERSICLTAVLSRPGRYNMSQFTVIFQASSTSRANVQKQFDVKPSFISVTSKNCDILQNGAISRELSIPHWSGTSVSESATPQPSSGVRTIDGNTSTKEKPSPPRNISSETLANGAAKGSSRYNEEEPTQVLPLASSGGGNEPTSNATSTTSSAAKGGDVKQELASTLTRSTSSNANEKARPQTEMTPLSRARSDASGLKVFQTTSDDAMWNASDTDDSLT